MVFRVVARLDEVDPNEVTDETIDSVLRHDGKYEGWDRARRMNDS